jgi:tetratricopeptide (TPR) repeat protein
LIDQALARLTDESARARYDVELANWKESQIPKETDWYAKANTYLDSESYDLALKAIEQAISQQSKNGKAYLLAAEICQKSYQKILAEPNAINFGYDTPDARESGVKNFIRRTIEYTSDAILFGEEENSELYFIRAYAFLDQKNYAEAERATHLLRKFSDNTNSPEFKAFFTDESYYIEAGCLLAENQLERAISQALRIGEANGIAPNGLHGRYTFLSQIFEKFFDANTFRTLVAKIPAPEKDILAYFAGHRLSQASLVSLRQYYGQAEDTELYIHCINDMEKSLTSFPDLPKGFLDQAKQKYKDSVRKDEQNKIDRLRKKEREKEERKSRRSWLLAERRKITDKISEEQREIKTLSEKSNKSLVLGIVLLTVTLFLVILCFQNLGPLFGAFLALLPGTVGGALFNYLCIEHMIWYKDDRKKHNQALINRTIELKEFDTNHKQEFIDLNIKLVAPIETSKDDEDSEEYDNDLDEWENG